MTASKRLDEIRTFLCPASDRFCNQRIGAAAWTLRYSIDPDLRGFRGASSVRVSPVNDNFGRIGEKLFVALCPIKFAIPFEAAIIWLGDVFGRDQT
jgi:hypothetical protein